MGVVRSIDLRRMRKDTAVPVPVGDTKVKNETPIRLASQDSRREGGDNVKEIKLSGHLQNKNKSKKANVGRRTRTTSP